MNSPEAIRVKRRPSPWTPPLVFLRGAEASGSIKNVSRSGSSLSVEWDLFLFWNGRERKGVEDGGGGGGGPGKKFI